MTLYVKHVILIIVFVDTANDMYQKGANMPIFYETWHFCAPEWPNIVWPEFRVSFTQSLEEVSPDYFAIRKIESVGCPVRQEMKTGPAGNSRLYQQFWNGDGKAIFGLPQFPLEDEQQTTIVAITPYTIYDDATMVKVSDEFYSVLQVLTLEELERKDSVFKYLKQSFKEAGYTRVMLVSGFEIPLKADDSVIKR